MKICALLMYFLSLNANGGKVEFKFVGVEVDELKSEILLDF